MNLVAAAAAAAAAAGWFAAPPSARVRLDAVRSGSPARTAGSRLADVRFLVTAGAVATTALAPGTALLIALAAVGAHHALRRRSAEVRRSRVVAALPAVCDDLSRLLLSGESPVGALRAAADAAPPELAARLREAAATGQLGGSPADALGRPGPYAELLSPLAASWAATVAAGAPLAPALRGVGSALAAEREHRRAVDTELAGPRLTGWLLAGLPVFGIGVAASLGSRSLSVLVGTPLGTACLLGAAGLDVAGVYWLRALGHRQTS